MMSAIEVVFSQPWVERLGWTLVHFLWQGSAIAAVYAGARRAPASWGNPNARYLLACGALAAMLVAPLGTWCWMQPAGAAVEASSIHRVTASAATVTSASSTWPVAVIDRVPNIASTQFLAWIVMAWLAGTAVFWVRLAGGWVVAARMRSMLVRPAPAAWQVRLGRLGTRIGVSRPVRLLVSALVEVPVVIGWLRPVVLVPVGAFEGLSAGYLEALLLHELAHVRRHDYLVNLVQSIGEALLFYHPAVWWVSGQIRSEREQCCDDVAVAASGDALTYASALTELEAQRACDSGALFVAASGGSLADRIARLLGHARPAATAGMGPGVLTLALLLGVAAYGLSGQSDTHPAFATVSIQRNSSAWSERFRHPMGLGVNSSLLLLIQFAYAARSSVDQGHSIPLPQSQIVGGPDWIDSEGYDIQAQGGADPKQFWLKWQTLLSDRFQLRLHRQTRELRVYVLTGEAAALKLPAPAEGVGCVSFPPGTRPHPVPGKVDCGYISGPSSGRASGLQEIEGSRVHMADLIRELASVTGRPVMDKTGFAGEFDLKLKFRADEATKGLPGELRSAQSSKGPDIFAALEQQLGLKLRAARAPVEVLVIDHAERPRAN